jgi:hypothetical protein
MGDRDVSAPERGPGSDRLKTTVAARRQSGISKGAQAAERASAGLGTSDEDEYGLASALTASTGGTRPRRWK